jgi:hypothetical protein
VNASIEARRYDARGNPLGGEFRVNSYTPEIPRLVSPAVASDPAGNFLVVWESNGSTGTDSFGLSIQGRRYDSSGAPQGDQFQVNTFTTRGEQHPSVAVDGTGNFVVVWQSAWGTEYVTDLSIRGRRYDSNGTPQGDEFEVNTYTMEWPSSPVVASDPAGNFIVVWRSSAIPAADTFVADSDSIQAQRYDNSGTPQGDQFQVSTSTAGYQSHPAVATDVAGNVVVVWRNWFTDWAIVGQRFDSSGAPQGAEFQVNTSPTNILTEAPAVTMDAAGNFVVAWSDFSKEDLNDADIGLDVDIKARRYDNTGTPRGTQFRVNTSTTNEQRYPAVASDPAGNFVVVWQSSMVDDPNVDAQLDIYGQRYEVSEFPVTDQLPGRVTVIKLGKRAEFVAKPIAGHRFALPAADPMTVGASLRIFDLADTAGDDTYSLPPGAAWKALGNPSGSKGFKYVGAGTPSDPCKLVLKPTVVRAVCKGCGVRLAPPFGGDIGIVLSLGTTDRYCAQFGGAVVKNAGKLTRRENAPAPRACP